MYDEITTGVRGVFWLPEDPDTVVPGEVRLDGTFAGEVILDGTLGVATPPKLLPSMATLHGDLYGGVQLTACDCAVTNREHRKVSSGRQGVRDTVTVLRFVIGAHVSAQTLYDTATVSLSGLHEWRHAERGWQLAHESDEQSLTVTYTRPEALDATLDDGVQLSLVTDTSHSISSDRVAAEQTSFFSVRFPAPVEITRIDEIVYNLRSLMYFATQRSVDVLSVILTSPGIQLIPGSSIDVARPLKMHVPVIGQRSGDADNAQIATHKFLFTLDDAPTGYDAFIRAWFGLVARLDVMLDLYVGLYHTPPHYLENQLMNVCQAAEGYHRRTLDHHPMAKAEYRRLCHDLKHACPKEHRPWLASVLSHGNQPSFKQRFDELIAKASSVGETLLRVQPRIGAELRNRRNDYGHWLTGIQVADDADTHAAIDLYHAARLVVQTCLLQDLGWSADAASALISRQAEFQRLGKGVEL